MFSDVEEGKNLMLTRQPVATLNMKNVGNVCGFILWFSKAWGAGLNEHNNRKEQSPYANLTYSTFRMGLGKSPALRIVQWEHKTYESRDQRSGANFHFRGPGLF